MTLDNEQQPIAWAFYWPDGSLRFIIEGKDRAEAWARSHEGKVVPLVAAPVADKPKQV